MERAPTPALPRKRERERTFFVALEAAVSR
ncbi:hypothetical protein GGD61_006015 [Bradyrhizobium sp. SBR1B]|nr:hypothetical protein [Bradyrhizobium sp. SBR1B]